MSQSLKELTASLLGEADSNKESYEQMMTNPSESYECFREQCKTGVKEGVLEREPEAGRSRAHWIQLKSPWEGTPGQERKVFEVQLEGWEGSIWKF